MARKVKTSGGNEAKALAAYQAGDQAVHDAVARYGTTWLQHLPIQTISYVNSIMNYS
jgi:hypothetical protein